MEVLHGTASASGQGLAMQRGRAVRLCVALRCQWQGGILSDAELFAFKKTLGWERPANFSEI